MGAGVHVVLLPCAVSQVVLSVIEAIAIYVIANEGGRCGGEEAMHKDLLLAGFVVPWGIAGSIRFSAGSGLTEPFELGEPDVVFWIDFDEPVFSEWYFAVVAESVGVDGQVVVWPVAGLDIALVREAEGTAYVVRFDNGPAGKAGIEVDSRGIFDAV